MGRLFVIFLIVVFLEVGSILAYRRRWKSDLEEVQETAKYFFIPIIVNFLFILYFILLFLGIG